MHRPSTRQADLDARVQRERRIGRRLLSAPETYTALAERPGRALLGGTVASLVIAMVVAVVAAAGSARAARGPQGGRDRGSRSTPVTTATSPSGPSAASSGASIPGAAAPAGAAAGPESGGKVDSASTGSGQGPGASGGGSAGRLPTVVSVSPSARACRAAADGIDVTPLFSEDGLLRRVELDGLAPGCVGREIRVSVRATDGAELAAQVFELQAAGTVGVGHWPRDPPLGRAALGEVAVEIL
jgi:hypothetical protein